MSEVSPPDSLEGVAIIGMAGRFPGADDITEFWRNLCGGVDSISRFTDAELREAGVSQSLLDNPSYVRARALFRDADCFDAAFFGYNPREADLTDPQHRVFLETAWQALEDAGCDPGRYTGSIGVYAGTSLNTYLLNNLCSDRKFIEELVGNHQVAGYEFLLGNDKDYLSTRVSYKLDLRGPSMTIQSACSTSLVAVCQACQSLLNYQCDVALAGAVSISFPRHRGYIHQEGSLASADGACRAFDARATGTVFGDGAGVVVLKRLEDAIAGRDSIYAVIKGFALNNDGASKVGYTAPSVSGQAEVIAMAQEMAGFQPESITCIEAHGTATPLGDPIEMAGLTRAFRSRAGNYCAIGSVKTNVGHLEVAAGVCGLIKMALSLRHKLIPSSLHFETPNPKIDFANSPFYVNRELTEWKAGPTPRRAGVSSFGVGGTNAHVVLEEAPEAGPAAPSRPSQLLLISAKTSAALERSTANLARWLEAAPQADLADVAWTLQTGRQVFRHRRMLAATSVADAAKALAGPDPRRVLTRLASSGEPHVVFMFPGQGTQYVNMGRELYQSEPTFRESIDLCSRVLLDLLGTDIREILYPAPGGEAEAAQRLTRTSITQPALFAVEHSLAALWMSWGIRPKAMIGHSVGEYVAACLAGVFSLEDALVLLARRARLMQDLPPGAMLAVRLEEEKLRPLLAADLSIAAVNGPALCVASGPGESVAALRATLEASGIASKELCTSHAFHSAMMDPILEPFAALVAKTPLRAPAIPYVSNLSADWVTAEQATSPAYWARHLREAVRFSDGVGCLVREPGRILLEVGPGQTLATLSRQHPARNKEQAVVTSLPNSSTSPGGEVTFILQALGQLWLNGAPVDWAGFYAGEQRRRVHLPAYPFERTRHFVEAVKPVETSSAPVAAAPVAPAAVEEAAAAMPGAPAAGRKQEIISSLTDVLQHLSGRDRAALDPAASFFELGFDSLFLTQASHGFRKKFGVKITFRQLMDELSCLDSIAEFIDRQLPPVESQASGIAIATPRVSQGEIASLTSVAARVPHPKLERPSRQVAVPMEKRKPGARTAPVQFSIYFFGNYEAAFTPEKYDLLFDAAKFADKHGFTAIWLPERHFHAVGGFSPNPALLAAALSRETERIQLRGGSVVFPLHHPIRIAEEWAVVDNLSKGRTGLSIASGWHPNDFVFAPDAFDRRREICFEGLEVVRKLWRGEAVPARGGAGGDVEVKLYPMPMQTELPVWLTCIHPDSFVKAGEMGLGVLGYLMNQKIEDVASKIALYRESLARHGHDPGSGHVTILLHTFVGSDLAAARETAREPLREYLRSFLDNSRRKIESEGGTVEVDPEDMEDLLDAAFEDYVEGRALIGTPDSCARVVDGLVEIGVDEVGCFLDFGIEPAAVLRGLSGLNELRSRYEKEPRRGRLGEPSLPPRVERTLPLTSGQQGLWISGVEEDGSRTYNESVTLRIRGMLDQAILRGALQALVNRHEALRTTIAPDGESQRVHATGVLDLRFTDLSGFESGQRHESAVEALFRSEAELFERQGPFMRAALFKLEEKEHLLLLTVHHIMGNGPSYWLFLDELCSLYAAGCRGESAALPAPMQLSDYIEWDARTRADAASSEAYWLAQFQGAIPVLELPTDRPRPSVLSFRGERQHMTVDADLTLALRRAAAAHHCSLFNLLLSAYGLLLHRLSGQEDVVIGVSFEDNVRELEGAESLFANTTNVMPIRSRIDANPAFSDYMGGIKELLLGAAEHQNYFFARLLDAFKLRRDPARAPIFSTVFNFENDEFRRNLDGLEVEMLTRDVPFSGPAGTAMVELFINIIEKDGALDFQCDHMTALYDGETVARWLGHFKTLLKAVAADPGRGIRHLPLLDEAERRRIVVQWNDTDVDYPRDALLHRLVEEQAKRTPDAIAVVFEKESLSYRELDSRANQLAHYLRAKGVGADSPVGICMERSLEMVTGLLGILKAGGAYVPLDPGYPMERVAFMMADARMPVLLTQERLVNHLPGHTAEIICLDAGWLSIARESRESPAVAITPLNLAYIIYTSGSTGKPKGAMNTHAGICNRLLWMQDAYRLTPEDRVLQKTPFSFDVSVWEFFWPLLTGARLVMARPGGHQESAYLIDTIVKEGITVIHFVPPMLAAFLSDKDAGKCRSLRSVISSGEALSFDLQEHFFSLLPARLHNLYGPTEASVDVTSWTCRRDSSKGVVPIGRPIANTRIYLLDGHLEPVPEGVAGELYIGGAGLARGYWGRPDLTAEKFIPDPFSQVQSARLYKTGDLARWRPDGNIVYLGRIDHQVKIRGFRIELEEIEGALGRNPAVREAVVIAREDRPGDRRLVGYVVCRGEADADLSAQLRNDLKRHLPEYMVPSAFVFLKALPLTANGKVDRSALPAPDLALRPVGQSASPPTPIQGKLTEIWKSILGLQRVGLEENFFEIGGNSLLGLRVVNELRALLDEHVALVVLFEAPTIAQLSVLLEENYQESVRRIVPETREKAVPGPAVVARESGREGEEDVAELRRIIESLRPVEPALAPAKTKNPPAIFILSPMRSGSTLCRVMLAGNPALFAPPELQLLGFQNLAARKDAFHGYHRYMLEGVLRAVMEMKGCGMEQAEKVMDDLEEARCPVQEFYRRMQEWIAPRMLVDKSPEYAMDIEVLRRAEAWFEDAIYIHLLRHPLGMIRSYEKGRFILESPYRRKQNFSARKLAELTWLISHQNIREFLSDVPAHRRHQVRFEDITKEPRPAMEAICRFLAVEFHPGMLEPYQNQEGKMTDGIHPLSQQVGDHNFLKFNEVRSDVADRWKSEYPQDFLCEATWRMAREFGYENPFAPNAEMAGGRKELPPIVSVSRADRRVTRATL